MQILATRAQRTLARSVTVAGRGLISGQPVHLTLHPAPPDSGIIFRRVDLPGAPLIPAQVAAAVGTQRRTTLGHLNQSVTVVEHLLAALAGLHMDNCRIDLDGPEPPGLDGSAADYVRLLLSVGCLLQSRPRRIWTVTQPLTLRREGATVTFHPPPPGSCELRLTYLLDYGPFAPIAPQRCSLPLTPATFIQEVAPCRTFLTLREAQQLRESGIGRHLQPADILVFGPRGPVDNRLRFADEPARHKILDLIGDLALFGEDLAGHIVACRSGHTLNVELARRLEQGRHALLSRSAPACARAGAT